MISWFALCRAATVPVSCSGLLTAVEEKKIMIVTEVTMSSFIFQFPQMSTFVSSPTPRLNSGTNLFRVTSSSITGRSVLFLVKISSKSRTCVVGSNCNPSSETYQLGVWEEPDDGSGSDYEERKETEEDDLDYAKYWEQQTHAVPTTSHIDKHTADNYEEDLVKEVEELLGPEERAILQENATPNLSKISTAKWKPLQTLALSMQIRYMDQLLENGVDINNVDKDGLTALHKAIIGKKEAVISHLLGKGASPHVKDRGGATPLHYAVQVSASQTVRLLIKYRVDVNVADNDGWTPLHVAVQSRNRDIVKILLVNDADKTRKNKSGMTALDLALCYGKDFKSYDLAKLLKTVPAGRDL